MESQRTLKRRRESATRDQLPHAVVAIGHGRIDFGAATDFREVSIPLARSGPATFNIAITPPIRVIVEKRRDGRMLVVDECRSNAGKTDPGQANSRWLLTMLQEYFGLEQGASIRIRSELPRSSGLGGSSAYTTCLAACLSALTQPGFRLNDRARTRLIAFSTAAEAASGQSLVGGQDAAACVAGHAGLWQWYPGRLDWFDRKGALSTTTELALEKRLVVAFVEPHVSSDINRQHLASVRAAGGRADWKRIITLVHELAAALRTRAWQKAIRTMREEHCVHRSLVPERVTPKAEEVVRAAEELGGAAAVCGAGGGGSVWALVPPQQRNPLRERWTAMLTEQSDARVWTPRIASGLRVDFVDARPRGIHACAGVRSRDR